MPIDRYHAFGEGPTYIEPAKPYRIFSALVDRLVGKKWLSNRLAIWRQFRTRATLRGENRIGSRAWCVNDSGRLDAVILGERTICRGLLRVEQFGRGQIEIGREVYIGDDCLISCSDNVRIGQGTLLAHGVQLLDNNSHPRHWRERAQHWKRILGDPIELGDLHQKIDHAPIHIGEFAWLGLNVIVMRGVTIGDRAIIAPGSVVTKSIPAEVVAAGNPARVISELGPLATVAKDKL